MVIVVVLTGLGFERAVALIAQFSIGLVPRGPGQQARERDEILARALVDDGAVVARAEQLALVVGPDAQVRPFEVGAPDRPVGEWRDSITRRRPARDA